MLFITSSYYPSDVYRICSAVPLFILILGLFVFSLSFLDQACWCFVNFIIFFQRATFSFVEFSLLCPVFHWSLFLVSLCLYFCFWRDIYCPFCLFLKLEARLIDFWLYSFKALNFLLSTALPSLTSFTCFFNYHLAHDI